jgi:hypothetical protein
MSQHDYVLENQTGLLFRQDLNNALAAIVSNNSGTSEPTSTFAFQFWADTTNDLLKIRNSANSAWVTIGTLSAANLALLSLAGGTMTGAILAAVGSASTPSVAFSGDSNTGMFRAASDEIGFSAGGTEVLRLKSDPSFLNTGALLLPSGTQAQRPGTPSNGHIRYNSDASKFEGYAGGIWKDVGGGGGGAGFKWLEVAGLAPIMTEENNEMPYLFGSGQAQELYASIKVPQTYASGTQIFLYVSAYSPSSSNTILLQAQSTLIRKSTDAFTSTTNQRTTTNSALTNTSANMLREFILDITSSTGQINSVSVSAGDVIKVKLYRGTDTDTADIRVIPNGTDVKFS